MTIEQKLKMIQQLSGLSQEKLAQKFEVSFATLNSWINGKSMPRPKAREQIEILYLDYTGQRIIPLEELAAKKQLVMDKCKTYPHVLKQILENPDIRDQFILSLTYHTNRIEGSTLTEAETSAILFQDVALPDKSLIEHLEVKNHQTALQYLLNHMHTGSGQIDEALILSLHRMLMNSIWPDAGSYRLHSVRIVGANVPTANYVKVPHLMNALVDAINTGMEDTVTHIAEIHSRFEQIHPFSDGNGRIGRLIVHAMALRKNLPPAVIRQEKKRLYYSYLNKAQRTQHGDLSLLEYFICDALLEGFRILARNGE
ncbi:MAG TPA: Fic family protein [Candidatus Kapabacteria bacterium]|nr:Fic family protein [Candidatus Kapabacteria bacterium]